MTGRRIFVWALRAGGVCVVADLIADRRGFTLVDPYFFIPFACLSAAIAGPLAAAKAGSVWASVLQACSIPAAILAASLSLLNLAAPHGIWVFPEWPLLLESAALSLASASASAGIARLLVTRLSPRIVAWGFRVATLAAILAYRAWPGVS